MLAEEFTAAVYHAVSRLPTRQREVVEMVGLENMSPREVAERLSVSENDVYVILHDARNALRKELTRGGVSRGASQSKSNVPAWGSPRERSPRCWVQRVR